MQYILKLTYLDGKDVSIILDDKQIPVFLEKFNNNEPYWQENAESAFMVLKDLVRYVNIMKYVAPPVQVKPPIIKSEEPKIEEMPKEEPKAPVAEKAEEPKVEEKK